MNITKEKRLKRLKRHKGLRKKVIGNQDRPRLSVFRSLTNLYCQLIDDSSGKTLASASTLSKDLKGKLTYGGNTKAAEMVGVKIAEEAKKIGITKVVFDKGGYKFHGRVKALAESARANDLIF
ncbi:MAG: 50S ribosomal protein L18 [Candidatus Scalindua sp. AMX11]|nr:MAG: 50S ribosomal protein L18 [Candidatus Scalindua sp.]NOG85503.1 50S ribosomal protein L18 [Planctomycetota bacterium]RZV90248.1 MAG: 50S ribosomal protein L18 [Candidatus Scalindua sp. SCAELEC01]TDE64659.1 MAG: 50S ribosomal protein L18 [Candidatus Scalindua sp. AMX11]GJQ57504.1 MAG: 50S ribosomal protein L18 [Candidatus Scalindua sp.]